MFYSVFEIKNFAIDKSETILFCAYVVINSELSRSGQILFLFFIAIIRMLSVHRS